MMKKKLSILETAAAVAAFAVLPAAFTSCSDDDGAGGGGASAPALTVSVADGGGNVPLAEGATAGIFAVNDTGRVEALASVTVLQGGLLAGADSVTAAMHDGVSLCAFSPAGLYTAETYGQPVLFSVQADQSTEAAYTASDLMMSPLTAVTGGRAALVMSHVMAKVTVHITDVTGHYDLSALKMTMPGRLTTVSADIAQGAATTVEGIVADMTPYCPGNTAYRATGTAIVAPGTVGGGAELVSVHIGGETFAYSLSSSVDWEAGKEYVYTMRLTEEGLVPYSSSVNDWEEGDAGLSGDALPA